MSSSRACFRVDGRVDRAVMDLALYVPKAPATEEERTHWDKNMQLVLDVVTGEDFPAGRSMQIGLTSGAQTHTVYGRNEPAMIHYHQSMRTALGLGPPARRARPRNSRRTHARLDIPGRGRAVNGRSNHRIECGD